MLIGRNKVGRVEYTAVPTGAWRRRGLIWLLGAGAAITGLGADAPDALLQKPGAILAADVTGEVTATYSEQKKSVQTDDRLRVDATVTTGRRSAAKLVLSNGTSIQLGSESEMEFEEFGQAPYYDSTKFTEMKEEPSVSRTRIRFVRGDVTVDVKPLKLTRGSSFTFSLIAGTLRIGEGSFRVMVQMSDLGLGVCTLELQSGKAEFEVMGGKFEPLPTGRKLGFAVEIDKATGNVRIGELPKAADAQPEKK